MGYRDDFYIPENIKGYTGDLYNNPTVYFENGTEYGRITQEHDEPDNVGRNKVRSDPTHTIVNELYIGDNPKMRGRTVANEYCNGKIIHVSRNYYISVAPHDRVLRPILAQAITRFTEIKTKYSKPRR